MNKTKFSIKKAKRAVEISSKIEGQQIPRKKTKNAKRTKVRS